MVVSAMEATAKGFANAVKRMAIQDKDFAMELAFLHNIRSEITPKALKQLTKDMFDKGGKLTESGRQELTQVMHESGLGKNATWDEVLQKVIEKKRNFKAKLAAIELHEKMKGLNFTKLDLKVPKFELPNFQNISKLFAPADSRNADKVLSKNPIEHLIKNVIKEK